MTIISFYINNFDGYKNIKKNGNEIFINGLIYKNNQNKTDNNLSNLNNNHDSINNDDSINNIIGNYIITIKLINNFKLGEITFLINDIGELTLPIYLNVKFYEILNYTNNYICIPDKKSNLLNNIIFNKKIKVNFKKTLLYSIYTLEYV